MSESESTSSSIDENVNHLSNVNSVEKLKLRLRYNDRQKKIRKLAATEELLPSDTIRDVVTSLLKIIQLEQIRPEYVELTDVIRGDTCEDNIPTENDKMTLKELGIVDGCLLYFEPSLQIVNEEVFSLRLWFNGGNADFLWYKSYSTVSMAIEYAIETFSLKSIERDRVHVFYESEEIDISLNCNKLLMDIVKNNYPLFDIEIIPPITKSNEDFFTSVLFTSLLDDRNQTSNTSNKNRCKMIELRLDYKEPAKDLSFCVSADLSTSATINDVIKALIDKSTEIKHFRVLDIDLINIDNFDNYNYNVSTKDAYKTLEDLRITNGCKLYFQSSDIYQSTKPYILTIFRPDNSSKLEFNWSVNTTVNMLLEFIIEECSLESFERKHICITKSNREDLDHISNRGTLLLNLNIRDSDYVYVDFYDTSLVPMSPNSLNIKVKCTYTNGSFRFEVPCTISIKQLQLELEKQFKDNVTIDLRLEDFKNCPLSIENEDQVLNDLFITAFEEITGIVHIACAKHQPSALNSRTEPNVRSSLISKQQIDKVIVIYEFPTEESFETVILSSKSVGELVHTIKYILNHRSIQQIYTVSKQTDIDEQQLSQTLHDYGINPGDVVYIGAKIQIVSHDTQVPTRAKKSYKLAEPLRSREVFSMPIGLFNVGNTCYMNSALQCLAHVKPLTEFILNGLNQDTSNDINILEAEWNDFHLIGSVIGTYADVIRNLWLSNKSRHYQSSYSPQLMRDTISVQFPRFATSEQQDAQEFMTILLDEMHKELKQNTKNQSTTIIEDIFFGKIQSTITCGECGHSESTTNALSIVSLPISQQIRGYNVKFIANDGQHDCDTIFVPEDSKVKDLIQAFGVSRTSYHFIRSIIAMANDEQIDLEKPLNELSTTDIIFIEENSHLHELLVDRFGHNLRKINIKNCFEEFCKLENLEDSLFCQQETCKKYTNATKQLQFESLPPILIIQLKRLLYENGVRQKIEAFIDYPLNELDLSHLLPSSEKTIYDLFAVCKHTGSGLSGHYTTYALHGKGNQNQWYEFDDSFVSTIYSTNDVISKDAYLLFYSKRNTLSNENRSVAGTYV